MLRNIGFPEILILLAIVALVFGVRRLPEIGAGLGKGIREFKKSLSEIGSTGDEQTTLPPADRKAEAQESREPKRLSD
jgi:sec-independent protein translocase protein TatA